MATPMKELPFEKTRKGKYPSDWFDGQWWEITPGEEGTPDDVDKARVSLYQAGRNKRANPTTRVRDGKVYFKAQNARR